MSNTPPATPDESSPAPSADGRTDAVAGPDGTSATTRYASVTPAGCYYAVESEASTPERRRLTGLLRFSETVSAVSTDDGSPDTASLATLVDAGFVALVDAPEPLSEGTLSDHLPRLLPALSETGRAVLTESRQGLFLDYVGVTLEEAEELAVLASRLRATADRVSTLLVDRLGIDSRAFGIVDPAGGSEIGFWPLHIGQNVFTLTIIGIPRFNSAEFRQLVWVLSERYGETPAEPSRSIPPL